TENADHDGEAGRQHQPGRVRHQALAVRQHDAERGRRRLRAEPEEAEAGFGQEGPGESKRDLYRQRRDEVQQQMARQDVGGGTAEGARRFDELPRLERQRRSAHDAGKDRRVDDSDGGDAGDRARAFYGDDEEGEQDRRKREEYVHHPHENAVPEPAEPRREEADERARDGG